ncbi:MAG: patatin-like phospholipase family protein [Planctomycetota bacterium]
MPQSSPDGTGGVEWIGPIGICLSGGGYRAAGFHLGTLDYLHAVGLGGNLLRVSTVSGGTFVGAAYAKALVEGKTFERFSRELRGFLRDTDLVKRGLASLAGPPPDTPSGRHDLIVAMADVYARTFMCGEDGEPFLFGRLLDADLPLKDVIFNATEFRHGIAFRFQSCANRNAIIGNQRLRIPRAQAAKVRLADVVASSSCFPGGFEPLSFPYDFRWPGGEVPDELKEQFTRDGKRFPVALMDGGIYDNQGAESLLLAGDRRGEDLGMFIISDVDQRSDDLYPFPEPEDGASGPTLGRLRLYALVVTLLSASSVLMLAIHTWREYQRGELGLGELFFFSVPLLLAALVTYALLWIQRTMRRQVLPQVPLVGVAAWNDLKHLRVTQVLAMLNLRVTSLLALTSSVFMKRIRGLVYGLVYSDEKYAGKRVSNLIYALTSERDWPSVLPPEVPRPSDELRRVATAAADMPTTLWFEREDELDNLLAAGQATVCMNLMKWIARGHGRDPESYPDEVRALWERLLADWKRFNERPAWLGEERG